jgi:DNA-binding LytR/AlgR family response regulator
MYHLKLSLPAMDINERLNTPFPYYLNGDRKNIMFVTIVSVFVVFFMLLYRPYYHMTQTPTLGHTSVFGAITFVVMFTSVVVLPKFFPVTFDPTTWTLKKYLIHTLLQCFGIGVISILVNKFYMHPEMHIVDLVTRVFVQVALIGIIPVSIFTLILRNGILQENLKAAIKANVELDTIRNLKKDQSNPGSNHITLRSDTTETLTFNLPDLLFIRAEDNYSTVYWMEEHVIQKKLLRANLKNIETQIDNAFTIRCHRSYVVNVHAISNITGNANGYKLRIKDSDHFIPVARPKGKEVMEKIGQLKNMMELY